VIAKAARRSRCESSAELHSAVSPICNRLSVWKIIRLVNSVGPQNAILRYCAARHSCNQSSADFQVCCVADFPIRRPSKLRRTADLEVGDTAGLETCATASVDAFRSRRAPCLLLNRRGLRRFREILIDYKPALRDHAEVSPPSVYFRIILVFAKLSRTNRCMDLSATVSTAQR
jgi:hypothetical protein